MSDALSLLRNFVKIKKDFYEEDDKIIFGDVYYQKNVKTNYLIYGTGKDGRPKDYYTLECLAFLIKNRDLQHPMYVKSAGTRNISVVSRPDRRELLSYLDGEVETASSIDKNAPIEIAMQRAQPYIKTSSAISQNLATTSSSMAIKRAAHGDQNTDLDSKQAKLGENEDGLALTQEQIIGRISKKFDSSQSQRPITENITDLSEQLTKEKIAAIKAKKKAQQRKQVSSGVELEDELLKSDRGLMGSFGGSSIGYISGLGTGDESEAIMKEIQKREAVSKDRFSVLQSNGKQFEKDINAFLQLIKAKEESIDNGAAGSQASASQGAPASQQTQKSRQLGYNRFDQERYAAKDETGGFSIDTKLTYQPSVGGLSLTPNPPQTDSQRSSQSSQLTQQNKNIISSQSSQSRPSSQSQKRTSMKPIIIIPNIPTSLITMINCHDILQDLKYVSADEKKKLSQNQNAPKDCEIIMHKKEDGSTVQYKVIDNINKLQPTDWDRVVAVFVHGKQWQFKDWPIGNANPLEIFQKIKAFHIKMVGVPVDPNIAKWSVSIIELDPHKRHLDRARLLSLWDELTRFVAKNKPLLCG
ncbi:unnamed protein product [Brachionus calyciflorus]|uniref:Parafibromin n=1 Tax=Brachionus calyciflorus TaxID=104777 RepID=A0A813MS52_9BILA|nr:unnamed protein product [Brachionus calyciflorus]